MLKDLDILNSYIRKITASINGRERKKAPDSLYQKETDQIKKEKGLLQKCKNVMVDYLASIKYGEVLFGPNKLIDRLKLLGGSIMAGNDGVVPEFIQIARHLNSIGVLPTDELSKMMATIKTYLR